VRRLVYTIMDYEREQLVQIIKDMYSVLDVSDAFDDDYREAMSILGEELAEDYCDDGRDEDLDE
jgi:hypothetical protein